MRTIWYSLVWKEWHEHKWKLASVVAILWGVAALVLGYAELRDMFPLAVAPVGMCMVPLALFVGLGAAAGEQSRGTFPFLQSLPLPLWRVAIVKFLVGLATVTASVVLAVAFIYAWKFVGDLFGRESNSAIRQLDAGSITGVWYLDCVIILAPLAASIFVWAAATGVNRRDEISGGPWQWRHWWVGI